MQTRHLASTGVALLLTVVTSSLGFAHLTSHPSTSVQAEAASLSDEPPQPSLGVKPEVYHGSFHYTSIPTMLAALHVSVYPEDKIVAFPDPDLGIGSELTIYRAPVITIHDGTTAKTVRSWQPNLKMILAEQHMDLGQQDTVEPTLDTPITTLTDATITRVAETSVTETEDIDYDVVYKDDADLEQGKQQVEQAGQEGQMTKTYLVRRENGVEVSRTLTDKEVTKESVDKIILRGTKVTTYGSGGASWYEGVGKMTAAHRTLPLGTKVRVVNVATGASVIVTIADRGPFVSGRIIDLSEDAFDAIGSLGNGVINVRLEKVN